MEKTVKHFFFSKHKTAPHCMDIYIMGTTYFRNKNVHIKENLLEKFQFMDETNFGRHLNFVL